MRLLPILSATMLISCSSGTEKNSAPEANSHNILPVAAISSPQSNIVEPSDARPGQIGGAWMDKHGTITLRLGSQDGENMWETTVVFKKTDKKYKYILNHISPIRPGEGKPVYPFPEEAAGASE